MPRNRKTHAFLLPYSIWKNNMTTCPRFFQHGVIGSFFRFQHGEISLEKLLCPWQSQKNFKKSIHRQKIQHGEKICLPMASTYAFSLQSDSEFESGLTPAPASLVTCVIFTVIILITTTTHSTLLERPSRNLR